MVAQASAQTSRESIGDKDYPPRYVSVVFGNPRSEECAGYGICKMEDDSPVPPPQKAITGSLSRCYRGVGIVERLETMEGHVSLSFSFLKGSLTPETVKKHFNATHFRVGNTISLPPTLTKAFDLAPSVFEAGLYQIAETKTYFQIRLQIN